MRQLLDAATPYLTITLESSLVFEIEQRTEQFLELAKGIDAIAAALQATGRSDSESGAGMRLQALARRLQDLSVSIAADIALEIARHGEMREALAASERQFRSLSENLPDNIARWDCSGNYLYVNPTHERTLGRPAADLIGTGVPKSHGHVIAAIGRVVATGEALPFVRQEVLDENGTPRVHEISIIPERDALGVIVSVLGIGRDVTEKARMDEALMASERHFRTLAENLPNYLARHTPDAEIAYLNRALETLLGGITSEVAGRSPGEIFPDGRFDAYERVIRAVARTGSEERLDLSVTTADGRQPLHHIRVVPERDETDTVTSVLTIGFDVTEQRRAEAELQAQYERILELNKRLEGNARELSEARARLHSVLQTLPDMVWMKDALGRYLSCNHAFERLTDTQEREILGKMDHDLFDADLADFLREKDAAAIEARSVCVSEEWVTYPDTGERALLETRKVPVFDADGKVMGVLGVAHDITERKRIDEMLASREREFRTLVEHSPDTVARYDRDLRRLYANPTFAALVEGGAAALIGRKPSESPGGPHAVFYEQKLDDVFASGDGVEFELTWIGKNGGQQCSLIRLTPERGADGTVQTVLAVGRDITELHVSREKIHRMAYYDPLTSLPNRTTFNERLRQTFADVSVHGPLGAVMMIDLDRFKGVNDTMGHAAGDDLLREAAARLRACVRAGDAVARLGGDEFAVLLPDIRSRCVVENVAKAIIARFDDRFVLNGRDVFVSCSIGIALYPVDSSNGEDLTKYADSAMYLAKRSGRRGFCFYSKDLTIDADTRLVLESDLRRAIERGELELHYQPKVLFVGNEVIGSEALLRWKRPCVGLVPPNQFIPVAEETGLIADLGKWVLREACRTAAEWNVEGAPLHKLAVNLSARQFQFQDLVPIVDEILDETGCRPAWLELEITESLLLEENDTVSSTLLAFKSMGLSIAIDDFGTGYSALSYLARFPIDALKIDKSFVQKVTTDRRHAELVKAILSIAHCLGLQVVAEGVETAEQAAFLETNGCQVAQGFLYSKPLTKHDMSSLPRYLELNATTSRHAENWCRETSRSAPVGNVPGKGSE